MLAVDYDNNSFLSGVRMRTSILMKRPKTLKGYLRHLQNYNCQLIDELKGAEKLTKEQYHEIVSLTAGIDNDLSEINEWLKFDKDN